MTTTTQTQTQIEKLTKNELVEKLKKLTVYTRKVIEENKKLKSNSILDTIISEEGITSFAIKNYMQNELVILCHNNQNHYAFSMTKKDSFTLLLVTQQFMINKYCEFLNIEEDEKNRVYNITLFPDKMTDKQKSFFNTQKNCNFTTDRQMLDRLKAEEFQEIESILNNYGYSIKNIVE